MSSLKSRKISQCKVAIGGTAAAAEPTIHPEAAAVAEIWACGDAYRPNDPAETDKAYFARARTLVQGEIPAAVREVTPRIENKRAIGEFFESALSFVCIPFNTVGSLFAGLSVFNSQS